MWKYFDSLPLNNEKNIASLGEGNTGLVRSLQIGPSLGLENLYFKLEFQNPSGSYKDRFASMAASLMIEEDRQNMLATSSGNTGSALAAYAARFGFELDLYVLETASRQKLIQAEAYGARVIRVREFGVTEEGTNSVVGRLKARAKSGDSVLLISATCISPRQMAGVKTISFEICEQLGGAPDHVFVPIGGGGLFFQCYQGMREWFESGRIDRLPKMHAAQPEGCATVAGPLSRGGKRAEAVTCTSEISGLQVASVLDAQMAVDGVLASGGSGQMMSDEAVYSWQRRLIREEGIYTEPAGATALAGLDLALRKGLVGPKEAVVCLVTGGGFKHLDSIDALLKDSSMPLVNVDEI
jgi:threonine synthase